jgi:hypothetical protein
MGLIIDYSPMYRPAEETYQRFLTMYRLIKKYERDNKPMNKTTHTVIETFTYDAFKIHPEIRKGLTGLESMLTEMLEKGFLPLKEEDICFEDPVTKGLYWKHLFARALNF